MRQQTRGNVLWIPTSQAACQALDNPARKPNPTPQSYTSDSWVRTQALIRRGTGHAVHWQSCRWLWGAAGSGPGPAEGQGSGETGLHGPPRERRGPGTGERGAVRAASPEAAAAWDDGRKEALGTAGSRRAAGTAGRAAAVIRASGSRPDPWRRQWEQRANPR